jgi:DNA-binding NarL/FixJ family response regulator
MLRLLVAEDHAGMRAKVVSTLEVDYSVIGAVGDGQEMLDVESRFKPDIVILDISMPTINGIEAATRLRQRGSAAKVVFLTVHEEPDYLKAAMATGAFGYVLKGRLANDLQFAVKEAIAGRRFVSPSLPRYDSRQLDD